MSDAPFFQLNVNEYLVATMSMSLEEKAIYLDINLFMWKSGGSIRFDEKKLAMMCRVTQARFLKIWDAISENFSCEDGVIFDEKMQEKLQKISEKSSKNSRSGALGGKAKQLKNNNTYVANARKSLKYARVSKLESELEEKDITKDNISKKSAKSDEFIPPDWVPIDSWNGFMESRKAHKNIPSDHGKALIVKKLQKLKEEGHDPGEVLDQSTMAGWTGIFGIKEKQGKDYATNPSNQSGITSSMRINRDYSERKTADDKWREAWAGTARQDH